MDFRQGWFVFLEPLLKLCKGFLAQIKAFQKKSDEVRRLFGRGVFDVASQGRQSLR